MPQPFEVSADELRANIDLFVDEVYASLESSFLVMPRGGGYVEYPHFQEAYECLKRSTGGFRTLSLETVLSGLREDGLVFVVLRTMLGNPAKISVPVGGGALRAIVAVTSFARRTWDGYLPVSP